MMRSWGGALILVVGCQLVGILGVLTTETGSSPWYQTLSKPPFQPPGWVFGPVWTLLYALMGIAAWRIVRRGTATPGVRRALVLFGIQLALNGIWTPVFFGAHALTAALVILVGLWVALLLTLLAFRPLDRIAMWLLVPYLAWVTFAAVLNGSIVALN